MADKNPHSRRRKVEKICMVLRLKSDNVEACIYSKSKFRYYGCMKNDNTSQVQVF